MHLDSELRTLVRRASTTFSFLTQYERDHCPSNNRIVMQEVTGRLTVSRSPARRTDVQCCSAQKLLSGMNVSGASKRRQQIAAGFDLRLKSSQACSPEGATGELVFALVAV